MSDRSKIAVLLAVARCSALAVALIAVYSALATEVPIPSPQELASWPAHVLLGAVCIVSSYVTHRAISVAYQTFIRSMEMQKETAAQIKNLCEKLSERPCIYAHNQE